MRSKFSFILKGKAEKNLTNGAKQDIGLEFEKQEEIFTEYNLEREKDTRIGELKAKKAD